MTELADQCASSNHLASSTKRQQMTEVLPYSADQLRFCQALPKIELHAHLNGSIRESTIRYSSRPGGASTPMTSATALITVVVCLQRASRKTRTECRDPRVSFKDRHANFSSSCVAGSAQQTFPVGLQAHDLSQKDSSYLLLFILLLQLMLSLHASRARWSKIVQMTTLCTWS